MRRVLWIFTLCTILLSSLAHAGVERRALRWSVDSVTLELIADDPQLDSDETLRAAEAAADQWNDVGGAPELIVVRAGEGARPVSDYDGHNVIYFHQGPWSGIPGAAAQTQRAGNAASGELLEADVVMNAGEITFCTGDAPPHFDLQSTLTHELGHVLGLPDDMEHLDATMHPAARRGDTSRRSLSEDDIIALGDLYMGAELGPGGAGCTSAAGTGWWAALALLLLPTRRAAGLLSPVLRWRL